METFEVRYAVPMSCAACETDISKALGTVDGVDSVVVDRPKGEVLVKGTAVPSAVVRALKDTGRDAIVRGSGQPNSAAVSILENRQGTVLGLVRMLQAGPQTIFDISLSKDFTGELYPSIRSFGDISGGAETTGPLLHALEPFKAPATIQSLPVSVMSLIGRSFVISERAEQLSAGTLAGVIARSAGTWENDKQICSCDGKTLWEERSAAPAEIV